MPRNQKDPQGREIDDEERELGVPRVSEEEIDDDEHVPSSLHHKADKHEEYEVDEQDIAEEIDLDDLAAMEGPDS